VVWLTKKSRSELENERRKERKEVKMNYEKQEVHMLMVERRKEQEAEDSRTLSIVLLVSF